MEPECLVHLWTVALDESGADELGLLSADERARAERLRFELHRRRFAAARCALRRILGHCLKTAPGALRFDYSPNGKPSIAGTTLRFNLSHSAGWAVIAVTRGRELSVDLEEIRDGTDLLALAERYFAPTERSAMASAPEAERPALFYRIWTRKEAYVKALGEGLSLELDSFSVSITPEPGPALTASARGARELDRWRLARIPAPSGFASALVVEGGPVEIRLMEPGERV